jgi:hypothetical protein
MQSRKNVSRRALYVALSSTIVGTIAQTGLATQGLPSYKSLVSGTSPTATFNFVNSLPVIGSGLSLPADDIGTGTPSRGGAGDAVDNWTNAAGGAWATGSNWSLGSPPSAADDAIFNLASTYTVTSPSGSANTLQVNNGVVGLTGGSLTVLSANNPGVGAVASNTATGLSVGLINGQTGRLNISGGMQLNYTQAYAGLNPTAVGILDISGAGTVVAPDAVTGAANGRFGVMAGNGTINIRDGAVVSARLFEFGRQDGTSGNRYKVAVNVTAGGKIDLSNAGGQIVLPRGTFTDATMLIDGAGSYVHGAAIFSGLANSTAQLTVSNGANLTGTQYTFGSGDGTNAVLNMTSGATATYDTAFTGGTLVAGTAAMNLSGANTHLRVNNVFVDQGGSLTTATGSSNINITNGAVFSVGRYNGHQDAVLAGATTTTNMTIDGTGSKFESIDGTSGAYIVLGQGAGNGTANSSVFNVIVRNNGQMTSDNTAVNTDAFISIGGNGGGTNVNVSVESGGSISTDGQLTVSDAEYAAGVLGSVATLNISTGGTVTSGGSMFTALDRGDLATINVSGASSALSAPGSAISFGGGNLDPGNFEPGGGTTTVNVSGGGSVSTGVVILARDPGTSAGTGAITTINIDGAGSSLKAIGPNTDPTAINDGYITTSVTAIDEFEFPIEGSGDANFAVVNVNVTNGGLMDAEEAIFIGDTRNGSSTYTVSGVGSVIDAGRQLSINTSGLENSLTTLNISGGGVVRTTSSTTVAQGSILVGIDAPLSPAGTAATTIALTGAGSTLQSSASILLGGSFDESNVQTTGTPVTLTAGAGTSLIAAGSLDLASNSTISTAGTVAITGVSTVGGTWTISGGTDVFVGTLNAVGTGQFKLTNTVGATPTLLKTDNVLIASTAKVDLGKNAMRIRPETTSPTTLAQVKTYLALGRVTTGDGGITSTVLAANQAIGYKLVTAAGTFLGTPTLVGDILVRATIKGDSDLNGTVNFDDLLTLAQNYNVTGTGEWYTGDFTFDGNVNFDDLLNLAQNYSAVLAIDGQTTGSAFITDSFAGDWALAMSLVPEPTSLATLGMASALISRRRR